VLFFCDTDTLFDAVPSEVFLMQLDVASLVIMPLLEAFAEVMCFACYGS
jgi:hypothetical protein